MERQDHNMKLLVMILGAVVLGIVAFRFLQPKERNATGGTEGSVSSELSSASETSLSIKIEVPLETTRLVKLANAEQVDSTTNTPPISSTNLVIDIASRGEDILPMEHSDDPARFTLEAELSKLLAENRPKSVWTNAGNHNISALISSYYWAMQMGDLGSWLECFSPKEKKFWQGVSRAREDYLIAQFHKSMDEVQGFRVVSAAPFEKGEYLITLEMALREGVARERFVVLRVKDGWLISNEDGQLHHEYHASRINTFDLQHK